MVHTHKRRHRTALAAAVPLALGAGTAALAGEVPVLGLLGFLMIGAVLGSLAGAVAARAIAVERARGCDAEPPDAPLTWAQRLPFVGGWFPREGDPPLRWFHYLPLISMFVEASMDLEAARVCPGAWRPARHRGFACAGALLAAALACRFGAGLHAAGLTLVAVVWLVAAAIDWRTQIIPDEVNAAALAVALLVAVPAQGPAAALSGAAEAPLLLYVIAELGRFVAGADAVGGGDIKLIASVGALLGWQGAGLALYAAACIAAPVGLVLRVTGAARTANGYTRMAFGPFIVVGALILLLR